MSLDTATAGAGAELTADDVRAVLVDPLLARAVVLQALPAARLITSPGPVVMPRITVTLNDAWRGQNEQIAETDPDTDEFTLLPSQRKSLKVLHRFSNELARAGIVNVISAVGDAIVAKVALDADRAMLTGNGADDSITGLANTPGVQTLTSVGAPTADALHDAVGLLLGANATTAAAAWFLHSRDFVNLRKLRGLDGEYVLTDDPSQAGAYRLLGIPAYVTNQLPAAAGDNSDESTMILADMNHVAVAVDTAPRVTILDQTYGDYDQMALRVVARMDIGAINPQAVVTLTGVTPPAAT